MKELFDLPYAREHADRRRMDVFLPDAGANGAAILWIHGGGFSGGAKEQWHPLARHFCALGYACASATYRMLPDWKFPAWVEDARLAMAFLRGKAGEYGFDPARIAAAGSSAGGYLALMLGALRPEDALGRTEELAPGQTRPGAVIAYCPAVEMAPGTTDEKAVAAMIGPADAEGIHEFTRVASHVRGGASPVLFLHGTADELFPPAQSTELAERFREAGGRAEVIQLSGAEHGFGYGTRTQAQKTCVRHIERFLDQHL
jgi:acetyl esterase/lipase